MRRILFPVDFSECSQEAAPAVRNWTQHFDAQLTLLHAVPVPVNLEMEFSDQVYDEMKAGLRSTAARRMSEFVRRNFADMPVEQAIQEGDPGTVITDWVQGKGKPLIMMPTHGHGTFRRFLVGSVTARVLHDAPSPVWTAAHRESSRILTLGPRRIVCAIDRDRSAVPLIRWAAKLAEQWGASLQLVHVLPAVDPDSDNRGEKAVRRYWTAKARQDLTPLLKAARQTEISLQFGPIAETLADVVREQRAGLLVIGRGHMRKALGRLRTHTMGIVCDSPCPVVSL